jgi:hypothetical protein
MGGASYPLTPQEQIQKRIMEIPQKYLAEELESVSIQLQIALDKLDYLIQDMITQCDCEDGCCK